MNDDDSVSQFGPRIGIYYGVVINQDHLDDKLDPIDIAILIENITGKCPLNKESDWKLDYDHSQCYKTIVIYNTKYTRIIDCLGYVGGWNPYGNVKTVPSEIENIAENITTSLQKFIQTYLIGDSYIMLNTGYSVVYFVG